MSLPPSALNFDLLKHLKQLGRPVSPSDIEAALRIGHADLLRDLEALARVGYEIEVHPYLGIRLIDIPDRLLEHEILDGLNTKIIARRMRTLDSCGSTNDEAWAALEKGEGKDGDLFIAEHQSGGRGRMGRAWEAARGGLYLSFIAKVAVPADRMAYVTSACALALANTIQQIVHLPAEIKWPNDIMVGGRKAAGILVESRSTMRDTFVIGIGVNVNQREEDFSPPLRGIATSLRMERKSGPMNRVRLLRPLLFYLDGVYAQLKKRRYERIGKAWSEFVTVVGKTVTLRARNDEYRGVLLAIDPGSGVRLRDESGKEYAFKAEHVVTLREA